MQIQVSFLKDLKFILSAASKYYGFGNYQEADISKLLYKWLEYNKRQVLTRPRQVILSEEIKKSPLKEKLDGIIKKAEQGINLNGYLGRTAETLEREDMLLFDWDIKHFHFDDYKVGGSPGRRSSELIFFREVDDQLYFIQIDRHNFSDIELLEIINRNWPDQMRKMAGVFGTKERLASKEIHSLRKSGLQSLVTLANGNVIPPLGGGYSTARTSVVIQRQADYIRSVVGNFETSCRLEIFIATRKLRVAPKVIRGNMQLSRDGCLFFKSSHGLYIEIKGPRIFSW